MATKEEKGRRLPTRMTTSSSRRRNPGSARECAAVAPSRVDCLLEWMLVSWVMDSLPSQSCGVLLLLLFLLAVATIIVGCLSALAVVCRCRPTANTFTLDELEWDEMCGDAMLDRWMVCSKRAYSLLLLPWSRCLSLFTEDDFCITFVSILWHCLLS